jgi:hypothetical protein
MKYCSFLLLAAVCAPFAWSQASPTTPATPPPPAPTAPAALKPRGPEAIAIAEPDRVVATIDGKPITAKQAAEMLKGFSPEQRKQYEANLPNLIQSLYMQQRLADEASKLNLDQQSPWKERLVLSRQTLLAQAYLSHLSDAAPVDDPQKYYDTHPDEFDLLKLSGIFVTFAPPGTPAPSSGEPPKTDAQALDKATEIEKKLKAGGDFSAIARTDNDNQQVASKGGELGSYSMGDPQMPPVLRSALSKLQPGQISEPVRIGSAYLIVKVESRQKQPFADVQVALTQRLKNEKSQSIMKQETDKYKIKVEDQDFFEAPGSRTIPTLQKPPAAK